MSLITRWHEQGNVCRSFCCSLSRIVLFFLRFFELLVLVNHPLVILSIPLKFALRGTSGSDVKKGQII